MMPTAVKVSGLRLRYSSACRFASTLMLNGLPHTVRWAPNRPTPSSAGPVQPAMRHTLFIGPQPCRNSRPASPAGIAGAADEIRHVVVQLLQRRFLGVHHVARLVEAELDVRYQALRDGQVLH